MAVSGEKQHLKSRLREPLDKAAPAGLPVIAQQDRPMVQDGFVDYLLSAPKSGLPEGLPPLPRSPDQGYPRFGVTE